MATASRNTRRTDGRTDGLSPEILDRMMPHSHEAERCVLGSMLLDPQCCDDVAMFVRGEDFYGEEHQKLYEHLLAMHNAGRRIDTTLLVERLKQAGDLDAIGGLAYLEEVALAVPVASNAVYYAQIVRDKGTLRKLIHSSGEILKDAYDQGNDARELLARAEQRIFGILEEQGTGELSAMADVLHHALERIDERLAKGGGVAGLPTGFTDLDHKLGGLHESELLILAARPSMGKTALATNIAEHVALVEQRTVLFVSLEMSRLELAERMLCSHGRINGHKLRNGFISQADRKRLVETSSAMSAAPLYIDDTPSRNMTEIAATARRLKRRNNLGLVIIDYLQLIEPDNSKDQRQEQVAKIARRLKGLARELHLPVLCLAQLNRQAEASKDNRPRLSHLRESGAIEQDADVVMFVHRESYYQTKEEDKQQMAHDAEIIVSKQRNGPTGEVKLHWEQDFTRFNNSSQRTDDYSFNGDYGMGNDFGDL